VSDKDNNDNNTPEQETGTDSESSSSEAPAAPAETPTPAPAAAKEPAAPRKSGSGIGWLALLLVLALAGGAAWVVQQAQEREAALKQRVAELESVAGREQADLDALAARWETQLRTGLNRTESALAQETAEIASELAAVQSALSAQQAELARFSATDRDSWLMAEARYLLRLANQRLIMTGDTVAAEALLASADDVLRQLEDPRLHATRAAVASDLAAVRSVPRVDVEGIYLRLSALIDQADQLVIFEMPEREAQPRPVAAEDWRGRLKQGYQAALAKLSDYIIIRRRDVPMQTLMDPQWEGLVRQNLRMLLEQAQVALLSGNQVLYAESVERAEHWVDQFRESDEARAAAMSRELNKLGGMTVAVPMPDISASLRALDEVAEQRVMQGGGE
jgi:uroporphyrin-3 C-methyltransferase